MPNDTLQTIFREVLDNPELEIAATHSSKNLPGWDSVNHVNLILALEERFDLVFAPAEVAQAMSIAELVSLLQKKGCSIVIR